MGQHWKEIHVDTLLNNETALTAEMSRFDRIMQHRGAEATHELAQRMGALTETLQTASAQAEARAVAETARAAQIARGQRRQQWTMIALTLALAGCTAAYTWINWRMLSEMQRANTIQAQVAAAARDANDLQRKALRLTEPNNGPK